jgi:hypothetical protein
MLLKLNPNSFSFLVSFNDGHVVVDSLNCLQNVFAKVAWLFQQLIHSLPAGLTRAIDERLSYTISPVIEKLKKWRKNYRLVDNIVLQNGSVPKGRGKGFIPPSEGLRARKRAMSLLLDEIGIPSASACRVVKRLQHASGPPGDASD